jgi:hypothetical protein
MTHGSHGTVAIEIDGNFYSGTWTVEGRDRGDLLCVVGDGPLRGRTKTTQLGGSPPQVLARIMLRELVEDKATGFSDDRW